MASSDSSGYSSGSDSFSSPISVSFNEYQLQRLEELFQECRLPNKETREQWSVELGIEPNKIKHWFKSRLLRAQAEDDALRTENMRIIIENMHMRARLRNIAVCSDCAQNQGLENRLRENAVLREEYQRLTNFVASSPGDHNAKFDLPSSSTNESSTNESSSGDEEDS